MKSWMQQALDLSMSYFQFLFYFFFNFQFFKVLFNLLFYIAAEPTNNVVTVSSEQQTESRSVLSNSLRFHELHSPWTSPGQNTGVGIVFPSPVDLSNPGIKLQSPALQVDSLPTELTGKPWTSPEGQC